MQLSFKVWKEEPNPKNEYYAITYTKHNDKRETVTLTNEKGIGGPITEADLYEFFNQFFKEAI